MRNKTEDSISSSWSINAALQFLNGEKKTIEQVKKIAEAMLKLRDEIISEFPPEVCEFCHGASAKEKVVNGLHESCRKQATYKLNDL